VRPSHATLVLAVLAVLVSGCAAEIDAAASASAAESSAAAVASASPSASAEPDWSALPSLEGAVTARVQLAGPLPGRHTSATAGSLWVPNGNSGGRAAVVRIDDETLEIAATVELGGSADAFPPDAEATAPGADGVWVTLAYQDAVALVDPATNRESRRIAVVGDPYALVEDGESLWIVDFGGFVVRVDIATGEELLRVRGIRGPTQIAVAFDGVWVADHDSGNIHRLDPATGLVLATIHVGGRPGLAIGFESIWARSDDDRLVARIDPSTNEVVASIPLPMHVLDIEVAGDSVWVVGGPQRGTCERNSYLMRIDPETNAPDGILPVTCPTMLATDGTRLWAGASMDGETDFSILSIDPEGPQ
jgi:streptogramin lyase